MLLVWVLPPPQLEFGICRKRNSWNTKSVFFLNPFFPILLIKKLITILFSLPLKNVMSSLTMLWQLAPQNATFLTHFLLPSIECQFVPPCQCMLLLVLWREFEKNCAVSTLNPGNLPDISLVHVIYAVYWMCRDWACYGMVVMLAKQVHS
jgi:hypothetical protein